MLSQRGSTKGFLSEEPEEGKEEIKDDLADEP